MKPIALIVHGISAAKRLVRGRARAALLGAVLAVLLLGSAFVVHRSTGNSATGTPASHNDAVTVAPGHPVAISGVQAVRQSRVLTNSDRTDRWYPEVGATWQWQLTGTLDMSVTADVYDVDGTETTAEQVAALHRAGRRVVCYVNAGAYEPYRPDSARFPRELLGHALEGWPDERWLDIRRWDLLGPLLEARFAECERKGFDAVEPDNVDGYKADTRFPLTAEDQLTFNRRLADLAHGLGLAIGLKNDLGQVAELASAFDFAVNEVCAEYNECDFLRPFPASGKPVFHAEYDLRLDSFCSTTTALGFSSIRKRRDLGAWRRSC